MKRFFTWTFLFLFLGLLRASAGDNHAEELIRKMDHLLHGADSSYGVYTMTIEKQRWKKPRVIKMKSWEARRTDSDPTAARHLRRGHGVPRQPVKESIRYKCGKASCGIGNMIGKHAERHGSVADHIDFDHRLGRHHLGVDQTWILPDIVKSPN